MIFRIKRVNFSFWLLLMGSICWLSACEQEVGIPPDNMSITKFEPLAGLAGDTIVIIGTGFDRDFVKNVVQFNASRTVAEVLSADAAGTRLEVIVPEDAQAGNVKIATGPYSTLSNLPFLFSPSIGSVNPEGALPGEQILISGKNFTTNLSQLLIYIGETEIDSIFGGSSTQIIFPLPEGLPVGNTTIRVGTRLTATDSVLSPPVAFTVFDPRKPILSNLDPNSGTPGTQVKINGNGFVSGTTYVIFDNIKIEAADLSVTNSRVTFNVPADFPIDGLGSRAVKVKVVVETGDGDFESNELDFTVIEPSDIEFYYSAINVPGGNSTQTADDSLYRALLIPEGGGAIIEDLIYKKNAVGVELNSDVSLLYYVAGGGLESLTLSNNTITILPSTPQLSPVGDLALDEINNKIYVYEYDQNIIQYDLVSKVGQEFPAGPNQSRASIKIDGDFIYFFEFNAGTGVHTLSRLNKDGSGGSETLVSSTALPITQKWVGLAMSNSKIYIVQGPLAGSENLEVTGNSTIYECNKEGTRTLTTLYDLPGRVITDIELSKDATTFYWMSAKTGGAIESAPVSGSGPIQTVIPGIKNGRYLDVFERD